MELSDATATPGIDPGTFRLVAQCLSHYATPGFHIEETIRYTIVLLLSTIVLRLQGLLLTVLTWVPVTGWLVLSGYDVEGEKHFISVYVEAKTITTIPNAAKETTSKQFRVT